MTKTIPLAALALALSFAPPAAASPRPDARLEDSSPGAEIRAGGPGGAPGPARAGAELTSRAELRTAAAPMRFVLPDGTRIELGPNSRLGLTGTVDVALDAWGKVPARRYELSAGEISVTMAAGARTPLVVTGADVVAAPLPGAILRVRTIPGPTARRAAGLAVAVYEGEARVAGRGGWKPILAGQVVEALADHQPPPAALPAAPAWAAAQGNCARHAASQPRGPADCPIAVVTAERAAARLALAYSPSPGATGYLVEIARDARFADVVSRTRTSALGVGADLPAGRYFARVEAVGAAGLPGRAGAARELRVVRLELPPGAATRDGAWLLPRGKSLTIADPIGLETARGRVGFVNAEPSLGASPDGPDAVRLRAAGSPSWLELRLAPSSLAATVAISPRNPTWPADTLAVEVRVADAGAPIPPTFEPRISVRVNAAETAVEWWRRGNVWRATLPAPAVPGPWIVRVEAKDAHDNELGRGFVEVIGPSPSPARSAMR